MVLEAEEMEAFLVLVPTLEVVALLEDQQVVVVHVEVVVETSASPIH